MKLLNYHVCLKQINQTTESKITSKKVRKPAVSEYINLTNTKYSHRERERVTEGGNYWTERRWRCIPGPNGDNTGNCAREGRSDFTRKTPLQVGFLSRSSV